MREQDDRAGHLFSLLAQESWVLWLGVILLSMLGLIAFAGYGLRAVFWVLEGGLAPYGHVVLPTAAIAVAVLGLALHRRRNRWR